MNRKLGLQALLLLLLLGLVVGARAQSSTVGSIGGTVKDPQGAAVPNAEVTIKEETTGVTRTVTTNDDGFYLAPSLPVGRYTVSTSPPGFKNTVSSGVELHVSERLVIDFDLQVGEVTETVDVTGEAQLVETRGGDVSSLISEKQVTELPLNGRNYAQLALMVPGVSPAGPAAFNATGTGLNAGVDMSVNGNASNANMWTVDGVNNMDVGSNRTLLVFPSIDSIQEFRVERNSFGADIGQAQGAVINLVTKGGSNDFHGTLFEFLRRDAFNATPFFLNAGGSPKGELDYHNYGGNFSGPIIKNRLFFFWSEEWRREKRGFTLGGRVPTAAERSGDFSGFVTQRDGDGNPILPHQLGAGACTTPGPNPTDPDCFPGNRIPANLLSPAGLAILRLFPDPTVANSVSGNNWAAAPVQPINTRQDLIRVDANITNNMNVMVRWINEKWTHTGASGSFWGDSPFPTLSSDWEQPSKSFAVKLTNTINSSSVNEFQFSRAGNDIFINTNEAGAALNAEIASKFPTVFPKEEGVGLPTFWGAGGYPALWHQAPWTNHEDLFIWKDDFSKVVGNHDMKFGVLVSHNIKDEVNVGANEFAQFCGTDTHTGNAIAELLVRDIPLGCYTERDHREFVMGRWHDFEFYGNDRWRIHPRVTLTLGLRWSRFSPAYSDNDRISNYIPRLFNGNPLSGLVQAGENGFNRSLVEPYNKGFQPRFGLAWDVHGDGKMAVRLGFGRFMGRANVIEDILRLSGNPPWTTVVNSNWGGDGASTLADDPTFRSLDTINAGLRNAVAGVGASTAFQAVSEDFRPPDSYQWNLTISREIMDNTVLEASYIGNRGMHIWRRGVNFNDVLPSARAAIAEARVTGVGNVDQMIADNRRIRGLGPVTMSESTGDSNYHGLQLWLNRRFDDRLAFQASYTWSHAISNVAITAFNATTTDPFNYNLDRGDSDLDRRHMFVANAVYVLPSFRRWGTVANAILGDWQLNGILTLLGGTPLDVIYTGRNRAGTAAVPSGSGLRPDLVPGVPVYISNGGTQHLNPAAFAIPETGRFGSLGRGVIRAPSHQNIDFSIAKNWRFRERFGIQFRAEMFNAFNHTNFTTFNLDIGSDTARNGSFGQATAARPPREIQFGLKFSF